MRPIGQLFTCSSFSGRGYHHLAMATGDWVYWVLWGLGLAYAVTMLWLAWWSLFGDRRRARVMRRCPRCWYDLAYSEGMMCSECGFAARWERQLHTPRRRWGLASLAVIALTLAGTWVGVRVIDVGWLSLTPTKALILALPFVDDTSPAFAELESRRRANRFSERDWSMVVHRAVAGDPWARPASDEWIEKYGNLLWSWRGVMPARALEDRLLELPARLELTTRESWPRGVPIAIELEALDWWPEHTQCRVRLAPRIPGAEPVTFGRAITSQMRGTIPLVLPPIHDEGEQTITIDATIERRPADAIADAAWTQAGAQVLTLHTRIEGDPETALAPIASPRLDSIMRRTFDRGVRAWAGGRSPVRFYFEPWNTHVDDFDDVAVGAIVELRRDGRLARRLTLAWRGGSDISGDERQMRFDLPVEDLDLLAQVNTQDGRWTVHVCGDRDVAMRIEGVNWYWAGEFTLPLLRVDRTAGAAPPRAWWREE